MGEHGGEGSARPDDPAATRTPVDNRVCESDPVDVASGEVLLTQTDVDLPGVLPLVLRRTHVSSYRAGRFHGRSWASTLDQRLESDPDGVVLVTEDGMLLVYPPPEDGETVWPVTGPRWPLHATSTGWAVTRPETGRTLHFADGQDAVRRLSAISDRNDNRIDIDRDPTGTVTAVRHTGGHHVEVDADGGRVTALRLRTGTGDPDPDTDTDTDDPGSVTLVRYRYDDAGRLIGVGNSSGRELTFQYDDADRMVGWADRNGHWYRYLYDDAGRCVANHGAGGYLNGTFAYDDTERTTRFTDALGNTTVYRFDERGNVLSETDPLGNTTTSEWDSADRLVRRTDPLGRTVAHEYDGDGNRIRTTRPDGSTARAEYNGQGLPTTVVDPDGACWRQDYDDRGNRISVTDPTGAVTRYSYDERGARTSVTDALGQTRHLECGPTGLPVAVTDPTGTVVRYDRDDVGRVVRIVDGTGAVTRFGRTTEGRCTWRTGPDGNTERWTYDAEGNRTAHVGPTGDTTRTGYTAFDLPAVRVNPDGSRTTYAYDAGLRLTGVTDALGRTWRYERDAAGRVVREVDFDGRELRYTYDAAGQLTARTNGAGETTGFLYDALGRVVERRAGDRVTTFRYDPVGRILSATNPDTTVEYERDARGRVTAETVDGRTVRSRFDALGRRVSRVTPTGAESTWTYDARDLPRILRMSGHTVTFDHDPRGHETERRFAGGATIAQQWDGTGRLVEQEVSAAGQAPGAQGQPHSVHRRSYRYTPDGSPGVVVDSTEGTTRLQLDPVGRVTALDGYGRRESYTYDPAGNIRTATWRSHGSEFADEHGYDGSRLTRTADLGYEYDGQGRVVSRRHHGSGGAPRRWRYLWNVEDQLTEVTTPDGTRWRYRYDALGRRIGKHRLSPDGTTVTERTDFTWDGLWLTEQVSNGTDAITWEWQARRFRPLIQCHRRRSAHVPQWFDHALYAVVTDLVGTPTELVDGSGAVAWRGRTTLWGRSIIRRADTVSTPWRFPGQYHDAETGLHYNYFRFYDPDAGRYVSPDPLGLAPSPNHYSFVPNPLRWLDPLGLMGCEDNVPLYRNVDGREFDSIAETGQFQSGGGSAEGKWFALNGEHADRWGAVLNQGDGVTMETNVPQAVVDDLHHHPGGNLDGIGPAAYADGDQVGQINAKGDGIRIWEGGK
ncbi:RHS repeat-associated core domain-containing protein [Saccharomonospora halophila]|uniref:RHS repeat-associated core domain-containing protein n=1 Tax=Saccharomonospora halophila TaxID=129922 RepID=UPI0003755104|nr:RHS repeat-associated core domain-containing protein [Saccharomonospora halophila]